ncbi:DcaP-like protein [Acinetobacter qingfengensis]|uniref:DcaP-like protein n=1 Tax=Acinetobacter qingfengensis TaxID=1262585 RepID=A0A1E7R7C3_9GAMM|nr:DcaP family trimeric outer membrane transporter [Acinetobacter qingfengensis]KAA8734428.1 DcaP-like protein [Acinetobacter qingfengensis]OEY95153.1 DcaP-like protein [Acinetobacter qingfengensis]
MKLALNQKGFVKKAIAVAVVTSAIQFVHAGPEQSQSEIEQLRAEVAELRALVQQQQNVQRVTPPPAPPTAPAVRFDPKDLKVTTQKGAEVKLYGFVRGDANYIIEGSDTDFNGVASSTGAAKDKLRATAQTTRLGLDFNTPVGDGNKVGGKIEVDFGGTNEALRIRHAYLTYNNWLFGQTTSNFLSNHAPEMLDYGTNVGGGTSRIPQVRYGFNLAPATKAFVALEEGQSSESYLNGSTVATRDLKYKLPVLTAKLTQGFAQGKGQASVRGLVEQYDLAAGTGSNGSDKTGWGLAIGADYQISPELKVFGDYSHVKGDNKYLYASNTAATIVNGQAEQNEFDTFQAGLTYKILPNLRTTLAYGGMYADDSNAYANQLRTYEIAGYGNANKEVRHAWINLVYTPAKPIDLGIEYVDGQRKTFDGKKYDDNRVGLMAKYSF